MNTAFFWVVCAPCDMADVFSDVSEMLAAYTLRHSQGKSNLDSSLIMFELGIIGLNKILISAKSVVRCSISCAQ